MMDLDKTYYCFKIEISQNENDILLTNFITYETYYGLKQINF